MMPRDTRLSDRYVVRCLPVYVVFISFHGHRLPVRDVFEEPLILMQVNLVNLFC